MPSKATDKANNGQRRTNPPPNAGGGTTGTPSAAATADDGTPGTPNALSGQHRLPPEQLANVMAAAASTMSASSGGEAAGDDAGRLAPGMPKNGNLERANQNLFSMPSNSNRNENDLAVGLIGENSRPLTPDTFLLGGEAPPVNDDGSSATAIVTPSFTNINIMQLEIPPGFNDDAPPVPAAQTDEAYKEMVNAIKTSIENTSVRDDAPPLSPAQIAAPFEDMDNATKASLKDHNDAPVLHQTEIARFYEETGNEKKGTKENLQIIEESQTAVPTSPSSSGIHHCPPTAPQVSSESPSPRAAPSQNSQTQARRGQRQAAAVIYHPPQSMAASLNDEARPPSVPNLHEVEATLVPDIPVYDAVQVPNEYSTPLPCWKRHQKWIFGGAGLLVGGMAVAVALGSSLGANNEVVEESVRFVVVSTSPSVRTSMRPSLRPSNSFVPSPNPSLHPTNEPTHSIAPTLRPSNKPSMSFSPSTYFSSLIRKKEGQAIIGDAAYDFSGSSVALSANGNDLAIGSPGGWSNEDRPGYVKVYHWEDTESSWELVHTMVGSVDGGLFGQHISFSGDGTTLAIGAPGYFGNIDRNRPGYVRVYFTEGGDSGWIWQQLGKDISGEAFGDELGSSVSLSGDGKILAIGAYKNDGVNGNSSGHVRVYGLDGNDTALSWKQLRQDIDGEAADDDSGWSTSLSADGKTVAIGAPYNDGNGKSAGHVRVYHMVEDDTGPIWQQLGQDIDGSVAGDTAGKSVSLSVDGKTLAIGANGNDANGLYSGYVRVYHSEDDGLSPIWKQFGQKIDGEAAGDESGKSVSLSADGKVLAIGAPSNNSSTGHVRIYHIDEVGTQPIWKQLGHDIDGEIAYDQTGYSVSLSADGKTVAIGSPQSDKNGENSGHVSVFNIDY